MWSTVAPRSWASWTNVLPFRIDDELLIEWEEMACLDTKVLLESLGKEESMTCLRPAFDAEEHDRIDAQPGAPLITEVAWADLARL
jgi:hypothetical protein